MSPGPIIGRVKRIDFELIVERDLPKLPRRVRRELRLPVWPRSNSGELLGALLQLATLTLGKATPDTKSLIVC